MVSNNPISYWDYLGLKEILFTLLVGPQLGDMSFMWDLLKDRAIKKTKDREGKDTICFKTVANASSKDVAKSITNGYGFILAHGGLFYLDSPIAWRGTLDAAIKIAQEKANKTTDKVYKEASGKWKLAKRKYERRTNQSLIKKWRQWRKGLLKRKPRRQPYPNPGVEPEKEVVTVTEANLEVKAMLSDKYLKSSEMLGVKFYGCYAGLMPAASAGHPHKRTVITGESMTFIEKDINALLDAALKTYKVNK
jgi:hypothetical protein